MVFKAKHFKYTLFRVDPRWTPNYRVTRFEKAVRVVVADFANDISPCGLGSEHSTQTEGFYVRLPRIGRVARQPLNDSAPIKG